MILILNNRYPQIPCHAVREEVYCKNTFHRGIPRVNVYDKGDGRILGWRCYSTAGQSMYSGPGMIRIYFSFSNDSWFESKIRLVPSNRRNIRSTMNLQVLDDLPALTLEALYREVRDEMVSAAEKKSKIEKFIKQS